MMTHPNTIDAEAPDPRCGECGGQVVAHRCVDCRTRHGQEPPAGVMPDHRTGEGCVCGHGAYNHGGGRTALGRMMGEHSRCIRCSCMEFRRGSEASNA